MNSHPLLLSVTNYFDCAMRFQGEILCLCSDAYSPMNVCCFYLLACRQLIRTMLGTARAAALSHPLPAAIDFPCAVPVAAQVFIHKQADASIGIHFENRKRSQCVHRLTLRRSSFKELLRKRYVQDVSSSVKSTHIILWTLQAPIHNFNGRVQFRYTAR